MAHKEQEAFIRIVKSKFTEYFKNSDVLDIGSLNINGDNKIFFDNCSYIGVDVAPGNNVNVVSKGHEYHPDKIFDVVISTECFEHDPHYKETINNMFSLLREGGLMIITCATTGRKEHGTIKVEPLSNPLGIKVFGNYYKNITEKDIREVMDIDFLFASYEFIKQNTDLYFWGIKNIIM